MPIYVPLPIHVKDALLVLADRENRDPRRQASRLIEEGLIRSGILKTPLGEYPPRPDGADIAADSC